MLNPTIIEMKSWIMLFALRGMNEVEKTRLGSIKVNL